jgi:hypothetical protein
MNERRMRATFRTISVSYGNLALTVLIVAAG